MGQKKHQGAAKQSGSSIQSPPRGRRIRLWSRWGWIVALAVGVLGIAGVRVWHSWIYDQPATHAGRSETAAKAAKERTRSNTGSALAHNIPDAAWDPSWPQLPQSGEPARPIEVVRATYAYAARRGDVLQYMPCYCGCESQGHWSNRDCFVKGKTAAGAPSWDAMGYT